LLQEGDFMKTIFNNRRTSTLYVLFAVSILSFAVLLLGPILFHVDSSLFALTFAFICMVFFGGIIIQMRSGPPW
jgi:hypothetical protein